MALPTIAATATGSGTALTTGPLSSALAVVTGQVIVLLVSQTVAARDLTVTDDLGHTWIPQQSPANSRRAHIVTTVATTTGNMTITTAWSASATWQAYAAAINDADGAAAVDVSSSFTQTALSCFAAAADALDTAANVIVFSVYACAVSRNWTETDTLISKGTGYLFQTLSSATALVDDRSAATQTGGGAIASAAASISIKGAAGGTSISVTDTGSGSDSPSITCTLSTTDTGTGSDAAPSCTASVPLTDSGAGSDSLTCAVSLTVTDSGSADDSGINIAVLLGLIEDSGVGSDVISQITQGIFVSLSDSGSAADSISAVAVELAVADTSSAVDAIAALAVVVGTIVDACSGADGVSVSTSGGGTRVATITFSARAKSATFSPVAKSTAFDPNL